MGEKLVLPVGQITYLGDFYGELYAREIIERWSLVDSAKVNIYFKLIVQVDIFFINLTEITSLTKIFAIETWYLPE